MADKSITLRQFDDIFRKEYATMLRFAASIINDEEVARDIVSDVFMMLWQHIDSVEYGSIRNYLLVSVRNRCISHLRYVARNSSFMEDYLKVCDEIYQSYDDIDTQKKLVDIMLGHLKEPTRGILEQCYLEHKKYAEVAELRQISPSTVKKHITKALKILRNLYMGMSVADALEYEIDNSD